MNKSFIALGLLAFVFILVMAVSSCSRNAYPRESYRGAGYRYDPSTYRQTRTKSKAYRPYKTIKPRYSNNRY
ncbi:MAG TPA: hypothetical protein PLQ78_05335 [Flavipsychrobacter sp.]|nr:hypothetical protein [Flavipsychrobacter sp.]